jgi:hypothetical protein
MRAADWMSDTQAESVVHHSNLSKHRKKRKLSKSTQLSISRNHINRENAHECLSLCSHSYYTIITHLLFAWTSILSYNPTRQQSGIWFQIVSENIFSIWCLKIMKLIIPTCELISIQTLPWCNTSIGTTCNIFTQLLTILITQSDNCYPTTITIKNTIILKYQQNRSMMLQLLYQYLARLLKVIADNHETTKHSPYILTHIIQFLANRSFDYFNSNNSNNTTTTNNNNNNNNSNNSINNTNNNNSINNTNNNNSINNNNNNSVSPPLHTYDNYTHYLPLLYPGLFVLLDKCRHRQRKQVYELLNHHGRALFDELNGIYQRDFKFGNVDSN